MTSRPISDDGWATWSIWEHSQHVAELYADRCTMAAEEMTCAAQAAELLAPRISPGDTLLDVGCGSGYFFHSLRTRGIDVEYWGIDSSPTLIGVGRSHMPAWGLDPSRLMVMRIDDLAGRVDHVVCMNVLSNLDNVHRPLERLLATARSTVVLRESLKLGAEHHWVIDEHLDPGIRLPVHVNHYDIDEVSAFVAERGFTPSIIPDRRTGGEPEMVIGHPHHWTFLMATREAKGRPQ